MRRGLVVLLALCFVQGCSSSYEPARSPRIATVVEGGQPTFVKNGVHAGGPQFGTGLVDAVHDNPLAEHHARVGRDLIAGGFVLSIVGLGTEVGGLVVLAKDGTNTGPSSDSGVATALVLGGAAILIAGGVMMLAGQPHVYDAINIYNDGLDAAARSTPAGAPTDAPIGAAAGVPAGAAPAPLGPRAR
jgi:hypothetical protein